jgi:beta-lactamase superfamily II metal-dependent hydrolase
MYEIDFLQAGDGNGDAICMQYGDDRTRTIQVVDGGFTDTADRMVDHIRTHYGSHYYIDHMVLTHADNDHAAGLIGVMQKIWVKHLWMNRPWLYAPEALDSFHGNFTLEGLVKAIKDKHPYLVELEALANANGTLIHEAFQGAQIGAFTVVAPSRARYVGLIPELDKTPTSYAEGLAKTILKALDEGRKWLWEKWDLETLSEMPEATSASNEQSVVQLGEIDGRKILLTGDAGPKALTEGATYAYANGLFTAYPKVVQVPHHGSRRNVTPTVLNLWLGGVVGENAVHGYAYCSVGKEQADYPRAQVKNAFSRRGYPVYSTRTGGKYAYWGVKLRDGWVYAEPEPFEAKVEV